MSSKSDFGISKSTVEHKRKVADLYDKLAHRYDLAYDTPLFRREDRIVREQLHRLIPEGARVLDVGCGTGKGYELLPKSISYVGLDISPEMLSAARSKFPNVDFIEGPAERIPFPMKSFDAVISTFGSLSHVSNLEEALSEISRVLTPRGILYLMFYGLHRSSYPSRRRTSYEPYMIRGFADGAIEWAPAWRVSSTAARQLLGSDFKIKFIRGLTVGGATVNWPNFAFGIVDTVDKMLCYPLVDHAQTIICVAVKN